MILFALNDITKANHGSLYFVDCPIRCDDFILLFDLQPHEYGLDQGRFANYHRDRLQFAVSLEMESGPADHRPGYKKMIEWCSMNVERWCAEAFTGTRGDTIEFTFDNNEDAAMFALKFR